MAEPLARPGAQTPLMEARDVTLRFGGVTALSDMSIDIGRSEILALIGPTGAGSRRSSTSSRSSNTGTASSAR
jgi:ABC-type branched-subunit amino acid transport system ATPase component